MDTNDWNYIKPPRTPRRPSIEVSSGAMMLGVCVWVVAIAVFVGGVWWWWLG